MVWHGMIRKECTYTISFSNNFDELQAFSVTIYLVRPPIYIHIIMLSTFMDIVTYLLIYL